MEDLDEFMETTSNKLDFLYQQMYQKVQHMNNEVSCMSPVHLTLELTAVLFFGC